MNMKTINVCGKRGLGDLVTTVSFILKKINSDSHIIYNYPSNFDYKSTFKTLMDEYLPHSLYNVTYEVNEEWSTVYPNKAIEHFGASGRNDTWFFGQGSVDDTYLKFKTKWKGNKSGPICLCLNNENHNPTYPYPEKWFDANTNDYLLSLVDNKNYFVLGRPLTVKQNIDLMANCSITLGVDGAWAHIANAMGVPFVLTRNDIDKTILNSVHTGHPTLKIIETHDLFNYLL